MARNILITETCNRTPVPMAHTQIILINLDMSGPDLTNQGRPTGHVTLSWFDLPISKMNMGFQYHYVKFMCCQ